MGWDGLRWVGLIFGPHPTMIPTESGQGLWNPRKSTLQNPMKNTPMPGRAKNDAFQPYQNLISPISIIRRRFESSRRDLGVIWGHLGVTRGVIWGSSGHDSVGHLGVIVVSSRGHLGVIWGSFGHHLGVIGYFCKTLYIRSQREEIVSAEKEFQGIVLNRPVE